MTPTIMRQYHVQLITAINGMAMSASACRSHKTCSGFTHCRIVYEEARRDGEGGRVWAERHEEARRGWGVLAWRHEGGGAGGLRRRREDEGEAVETGARSRGWGTV